MSGEADDNNSVNNTPENLFLQIYATSETDLVAQVKKRVENDETTSTVLSIREELIERVLDECYQSYLRKQTVKFVVQCAYDALVKFLSFNFYYHPKVPDTKESIWKPDEPLKPSPKDSWACNAVPIRPLNYQMKDEDIIIGTRTETSKESLIIPTDEEIKCCDCMEHVCLCLVPPEDLSKRFQDSLKTFPSKVKFTSSKSSRKPSINGKKTSSNIPASEMSQIYSDSSSSSEPLFIATSDIPTSTDDDEEKESTLRISNNNKSKISKRKEKPAITTTKRVVLEVPEMLLTGTTEAPDASLDLAPIRVNSIFSSKVAVKEKKNR